MAIIALGVLAMIAQRRVSFGPLVVTAFGFVLLADRPSWTDESVFWPTVLAVIGVAILFNLGSRQHHIGRGSAPAGSIALFSGTKIKDRSEHLNHAGVSAVFGGATLDLRKAHRHRSRGYGARLPLPHQRRTRPPTGTHVGPPHRLRRPAIASGIWYRTS